MLDIMERYNNFADTIKNCCSVLLTLNDDRLLYVIFEKLSIDVACYLHPDSLKIFLDDGYINLDIFNRTARLREDFLNLEKKYAHRPSAYFIRNSEEWNDVFKQADKVCNLLYL